MFVQTAAFVIFNKVCTSQVSETGHHFGSREKSAEERSTLCGAYPYYRSSYRMSCSPAETPPAAGDLDRRPGYLARDGVPAGAHGEECAFVAMGRLPSIICWKRLGSGGADRRLDALKT